MRTKGLCFNLIAAIILAAAAGILPYSVNAVELPIVYNFNLQGNYVLNEWNSANLSGNYPVSMRFYHTSKADPDAQAEAATDYTGDYSHTLTGYVYGLENNGFAFQNNASSKLGIAMMRLCTVGRDSIGIQWTGRTIKKNSARTYALTLEIKLPADTVWTVLNEYVSSSTSNNNAGDSFAFPLIIFPERFNNQNEMLLRWIYNYKEGSGNRPKLAVDDILITSRTNAPIIISGIHVPDLKHRTYAGTEFPKFSVEILKNGDSLQSDYNGFVALTAVKDNQIKYVDTAEALGGKAYFEHFKLPEAGNYFVKFTCADSNAVNNQDVVIDPAIAFSDLLIPEYMSGYNRIPYVAPGDSSDKKYNWKIPGYALVKLENLIPGREYRYSVRALAVSDSSDLTKAKSAQIYRDEVRDSVYFSSKYVDSGNDSLCRPQPFSAFIADSVVKYLWINIVPNTLGMFENGRKIYWVLNLAENDGRIFKRFKSDASTQMITFGWNAKNCTGITDTASAIPEGSYVAFYSEGGTRPMTIAAVQSDGAKFIDMNNSTENEFTTSGPQYYIAADEKPHAWATIIPNAIIARDTTEAGIRKIEIYNGSGEKFSQIYDSDGVWNGVNTNAAAGGKYFPVYLSIPSIGAFNVDENLCSGSYFEKRIKIFGSDSVKLYYKKTNEDNYHLLLSDKITEKYSDGSSMFKFTNNFPASFEDYGSEITVKVICPEHPEVFAESNPFIIYYAPKFTKISGGGIYCGEDTVKLSVDIEGNYTELQWFKDGVLLPGENRRVLKIYSSGFEKTGEYSCKAKAAGSCSDINTGDIMVYIQNSTRIIDQPKDVYAVIGGKAKFEVTSNAVGAVDSDASQYQWLRDGREIFDNEKYSGSHSSQLSVIGITPEDGNSEFTVVVTGLCGSAESCPAKIHPIDLKIAASPSDTSVCSGDQLRLAVEISGTVHSEFVWYKNGKQILNADSSVYTVENAGSSDSGCYFVKVIDPESGFSIISNSFILKINTPPMVKSEPEKSYEAAAGDILDLEVILDNPEGADFAWYHDGILIENSNISKLSIAIVGTKQTGIYYCEISNKCGTVRTSDIAVSLKPGGYASVAEKSGREIHVGEVFPNPVSTAAVINYDIPAAGNIRIELFNESGEKIAVLKNEFESSGIQSIKIDPEALHISAGGYFLLITTNYGIATRKFTVIK